MCLLTPPGSFGLLPVGGPSEDAPMPLHDVLLPDVVFANLPSGRDTVMGHHIVVDSGRWRRELAERQNACASWSAGGWNGADQSQPSVRDLGHGTHS
jgi:hypothetical protein